MIIKLILSVFLFLLLVNVVTYSQFYSELHYESATSIEIESGADVCADDIIINGTYSGTGTLCLGALPVTFVSFTSVININNVTLNWSTAIEINNSGFQIERKGSGDSSSWINISFTSGAGTTNEPKNYSFADNNLYAGSYYYRLKQFDYNGNFEYFILENPVFIAAPQDYALGQNYPNPSNPKSKIDFKIPLPGIVIITVYNLLGQKITQLLNESKEPGYHYVEFDGSNYPSGVYIYKIVSGGFTDVKKLILVK